MRAVVQRVKEASVLVASDVVGRTGAGLLVYLGVGHDDSDRDIDYLAKKIAGLRIFSDNEGLMNRCVVDVGGSALVVSQFTLIGDVRRGKRPSFAAAMEPIRANAMYERFCSLLVSLGVPLAKGEFGAMMEVSSINDGPVTILLDSKKTF